MTGFLSRGFSRFLVFLILVLSPESARALSEFYWERPEIFSTGSGNFPVSAYNERLSVIAWQEKETSSSRADGGTIGVSVGVKASGGAWRIKTNVGGPYPYAGTEPALLSVAVDKRNRILIAAAASSTETEILISDDQGESFYRYRVYSGSESSLAPRIFVRSDGGYLLFVTRGGEQSLTIYYARSDNGYSWSNFEPFMQNENLTLNFLPSYASLGSTDYVVFQSFVGEGDTAPTFQLFFKTSSDGGKTWTRARQFTTFPDPRINTTAVPARFDNQRPHLSSMNNSLLLVWERRFGSGSPQIYAASLGPDTAIRGTVERVNSVEAYCNNPLAFLYQGEPTVVWFDNRRGNNRVFLAQRGGLDWQNHDLSGNTGESSFARPLADNDGISIFWQTANRIVSLVQDTTVSSPEIRAENFTPGKRNRGDRVRVSWNTPEDSSGILGFSWLWSRDENEDPSREVMGYRPSSTVPLGNERTRTDLNADEDGSWFFSVIAQDFAGNWSKPSRIEYIRDTTPPPAANIIPPDLDEQGFLLSNTFELYWEPPLAPDLAGYTWNLEYLGPSSLFSGMDEDDFATAAESRFPRLPSPIPRLMGEEALVSYRNQDDGVYSFSLFCVDEVGNIGPPARIFFRTDKYIPQTYITYVDARQDEQGILSIGITGRGFTLGGDLSRIFLERQEDRYRLDLFPDEETSVLLSDREIRGIRIDEIDQGLYRVGVEHPLRGIYMYPQPVRVRETGTVKFGDYSRTWESVWSARPGYRYTLDASSFTAIAIMIFGFLGLLISIRGITGVMTEGKAIRFDAAALITGDFMPLEKKMRLKKIRRRGIGLRLKLASFTIVLVLLVVAIVSAPLYLLMTGTQRETLFKGLWDRSSVLLEGLASGARVYLPSQSTLELGFLLGQMDAVPEARYVTITGFGGGTTISSDHIWATNDPDIIMKIDTATFAPGVSRLRDELSHRLESIIRTLDEQAEAQVGGISKSITELTREGLALTAATDSSSRQRLQDIQISIRSLETQMNEGLAEIGRGIGSEPEFSLRKNPSTGSHSYLFFKPVLFRQGADTNFFRGLIRLEVSIDLILEDIAEGQRQVLRIILIVALAAIGIGAAGALILSTFLIRPITTLVSHVEQIRDTEDKAKLEGVDIQVRSKDELAVLGTTINDMTHGLVKAAQAAADLSIGKEIQKKFIPLELDKEGNKLSVGSKDTLYARFFGYYEGAKGVSGDYFDYQDLDGRYYAIIKCDVAGKGIPAALIMIQVATMFLNYFKNWKPSPKKMHIEEVVYQINDFIETLGFKGRFAAFTLCLFDSQTGLLRFCNAGDNLIHIYDASEKQVKTITLVETPATGVLPNILVESKGGYRVQTLVLDPGDLLLLYTDGIEEAKRKFRDSNFREILCASSSPGQLHGTHTAGQGDEELGADRVAAIINAVQNREVYSLHKYHNPEGEIELKFDFTNCQGAVEETIMALVSVEKIFRCYKNPQAQEDSLVLVDRKVDSFLKQHFLQYRAYCSYSRDYPGNDAYMYYTHLNEDDQYDDLTILGIMRKIPTTRSGT